MSLKAFLKSKAKDLLMNKLYKLFLKLVSKLIPIKKGTILFESHEDFSEGTYRLFEYMKNGTDNKTWWYISKENRNKAKTLGVKKFIIADGNFFYKYVIKPLKYYRMNYVLFTHRFPGFSIEKQGQFCLFFDHGQPFKYVPAFQKQIPSFSYRLTNNHFTGSLLMEKYKIPEEKLIFSMNPRVLPLLYSDKVKTKKTLKINKESKVLVCLPTWNRKLYLEEDLYIDFPIRVTKDDLIKLNICLKEHNCFLIFKFHPMVKNRKMEQDEFSNIIVLNNKQILSKGIDVYDLLSCSDCLITDFSSIFIDYYLLDKPVIFLGGNYDAEKKNQPNEDGGFVFDNYMDYLCGPICFNFDDLYLEILNVLKGKDGFKSEREKVSALYNCYVSSNLCIELENKIKESLNKQKAGK